MADHLKVSTSDLREISTSVGTLKTQFEHSTDLVDSFHGFIGSGELADALSDFAGDWSKKRKQLCDGLAFLGKAAKGAADAYDGVDGHLADALLKGEKKAGGDGK